MSKRTYQLLNAGDLTKWERFGDFVLERPYFQGVWPGPDGNSGTDASFDRRGEKGEWEHYSNMPNQWICHHGGLQFQMRLTPFGHIGLFPEHATIWDFLAKKIQKSGRKEIRALNLFAYTGGASLAMQKAGAQVVHVDAAKGIVDWAKENAQLNKIDNGVRFIVEDARKFVKRELRRESRYDIILLDPPSFGRGSKGEIFKVEDDLNPLLEDLKALLSDDPLAFVLSSHTPGWTPVVLKNILSHYFASSSGLIHQEELCLTAQNQDLKVPCGAYASWESA